jgi:protein gp37
MGQNSSIEWTDHTHNHWIGCTHVSPGCEHCYAETLMDQRWGKVEWGKGKPRLLTSEANRRKPLAWNKAAAKNGARPRVFSASLSDWLDEEVPIEWLADLLTLIERTPHLDWLLLSKRIDRWSDRLHRVVRETHDGADTFASRWLDGDAPDNVWAMTSVEDQRRADERIPYLLRVPARVRGLSCEPLLSTVDLSPWMVFEGQYEKAEWMLAKYGSSQPLSWVIAGGESGAGARPMRPDWARSLRDQASAADVAFFFKQFGEFLPRSQMIPGVHCSEGEQVGQPDDSFVRVGKHAAGRLLDGREWSEFPEVPQ